MRGMEGETRIYERYWGGAYPLLRGRGGKPLALELFFKISIFMFRGLFAPSPVRERGGNYGGGRV